MQLISKLTYKARKLGLNITKNDDDVKIMNIITGRYVHILPTGKVCSDDILGHDKALKDLMNDFLVKDPFSGSSLTLPCKVYLHVGKDADPRDVTFAKHCLSQCFENIKNFKVIEDHDLQSHECRIEHNYALSYKERQAFISACLEYLQ